MAVEEVPVPRRSAWKSPILIGGIIVLGLGTAYRFGHGALEPDHSNYKVHWPAPGTWKNMPHSPQALWFYLDPVSKDTIRGSTTQIVFENNPMPGQDANAVANDMIDATKENQSDTWKAERLKDVHGHNLVFTLVRRDKKDKSVVTAVAVKGNTTLLVALSASGASQKSIEDQLPHFVEFVKGITLSPTVID